MEMRRWRNGRRALLPPGRAAASPCGLPLTRKGSVELCVETTRAAPRVANGTAVTSSGKMTRIHTVAWLSRGHATADETGTSFLS